MKLLWLCNMVPGKVKEAVSGGSTGGGLWVDSVLEGLLERAHQRAAQWVEAR